MLLLNHSQFHWCAFTYELSMSPAPQAKVMLRNAGARAIRLRRKERSAVAVISHQNAFLERVDVECAPRPTVLAVLKTPFE